MIQDDNGILEVFGPENTLIQVPEDNFSFISEGVQSIYMQSFLPPVRRLSVLFWRSSAPRGSDLLSPAFLG